MRWTTLQLIGTIIIHVLFSGVLRALGGAPIYDPTLFLAISLRVLSFVLLGAFRALEDIVPELRLGAITILFLSDVAFAEFVFSRRGNEEINRLFIVIFIALAYVAVSLRVARVHRRNRL